MANIAPWGTALDTCFHTETSFLLTVLICLQKLFLPSFVVSQAFFQIFKAFVIVFWVIYVSLYIPGWHSLKGVTRTRPLHTYMHTYTVVPRDSNASELEQFPIRRHFSDKFWPLTRTWLPTRTKKPLETMPFCRPVMLVLSCGIHHSLLFLDFSPKLALIMALKLVRHV